MNNSFIYLEKLYSCNIKSNVVKVSIKIEQDYLVYHLELDKITSFELSGSYIIKLKTIDEVHYFLEFVSDAEALKGYQKIEDAINGSLIMCTDTNVNTNDFQLYNYKTKNDTFTYPALVMIDDIAMFEVNTYNELISKLNDQYVSVLYFGTGSNQTTLDISYLVHNSPAIPKKIELLDSYYTIEFTGTTLMHEVDFYNKDYFVAFETSFKKNQTVFEYTNANFKSLRIYYTGNYLRFLHIGLADKIKVSGIMPSISEFKSSKTELEDVLFLNNSFSTLRTIELTNNKITTFLSDIYLFKVLNDITLKSTKITTLVCSLPNTYVTSLVIEDTPITSIPTIQSVRHLYLTLCTALTTLDLTGYLCDNIMIQDCTELTNIICSSTVLRLLKITGTKITSLPSAILLSKKIINCDISNNIELDATTLETFVNDFVVNNVALAGTLSMLYNTEMDADMIAESISILKARQWFVQF